MPYVDSKSCPSKATLERLVFRTNLNDIISGLVKLLCKYESCQGKELQVRDIGVWRYAINLQIAKASLVEMSMRLFGVTRLNASPFLGEEGTESSRLRENRASDIDLKEGIQGSEAY
jgi:hypothetical protein